MPSSTGREGFAISPFTRPDDMVSFCPEATLASGHLQVAVMAMFA